MNVIRVKMKHFKTLNGFPSTQILMRFSFNHKRDIIFCNWSNEFRGISTFKSSIMGLPDPKLKLKSVDVQEP